jgi:predicted esterase
MVLSVVTGAIDGPLTKPGIVGAVAGFSNGVWVVVSIVLLLKTLAKAIVFAYSNVSWNHQQFSLENIPHFT